MIQQTWEELTASARKYAADIQAGYGIAFHQGTLDDRTSLQRQVAHDLVEAIQPYLWSLAYGLKKRYVELNLRRGKQVFSLKQSPLEEQELVNEASLQIMQKFGLYKPEYSFSSFARVYGTSFMYNYARSQGYFGKINRNISDAVLHTVSRSAGSGEAMKKISHHPSISHRGEDMPTPAERAVFAYATCTGIYLDLFGSVPSKADSPSAGQLEEIIADPEERQLDETDLALKQIRKVFAALSDREKTILEGIYVDGKTYESIGENLGLYKERIRQIHLRTIRKLREELWKTQYNQRRQYVIDSSNILDTKSK